MAEVNYNNDNMDFDWEKNTWEISDLYFKNSKVLVDHHIQSYNYFITEQIQQIVKEKNNNPIVIYNEYSEKLGKYMKEFHVEFGDISISKPEILSNDGSVKQMYPDEARLRNLTYSSELFIDIHSKYIDNENNSKSIEYPPLLKYPCGKIPIMLRSKFCILNDLSTETAIEMGEGKYDNGGYFIIKGSEKVIVSQEKKCENKVYCFNPSKHSGTVEISSVNLNYNPIPSPCYIHLTMKNNLLKIKIKRMKQDLPLVIVFRALGIISDKDIIEKIVQDLDNPLSKKILDILKPSLEESSIINNQVTALEYLSKNLSGVNNTKGDDKVKLKYTYDLLIRELLPHIGDSPVKKAYFMGYMVKRLFECHFGLRKHDDRDSFLNKRVETSGELMAQLFRSLFTKFVKDLKMGLQKDHSRIDKLGESLSKRLKTNDIEGGMKYALGTGSWGLKNQSELKKGIAQLLPTLNNLNTLSTLRRIIAPIGRTGKQTAPRKLHNTQYGVICPFETPEGGSVGIVKNMALTTHISIETDPTSIYEYLEEYGVLMLEDINPIAINRSVKVFVNGNWIGQSFEPNVLVQKMRVLKRSGLIDIYTSISWNINDKEIKIWTDGGRLCRPLYIVENNKLKITDDLITTIKENNMSFKDLLIMDLKNEEISDKNAIIEYVDIEEIDTLMVAMTQDSIKENKRTNETFYNYTHCEIHPSLILGALATNIVFSNHNYGVRNLYQGAMGKQAVGIYTTSFKQRMDTLAHILHYPQKPIINTEPSKYIHSDVLPTGQNAIVAIGIYTGYNQEDSLIFNQNSIDRGLFNSSFYRTYKDEEKKNQSTLVDEKFCKPEQYYPDTDKIKTEKMGIGNYDKLNEDGFIKEGTFVGSNDVIIGKTIPLKDAMEGAPKYRDSSTKIKPNESGFVDKVYVNTNADGYKFAKVKVRSDRIPQIGDKFCVDDITEILTNDGWKYFKDLSEKDYVATLVNDNELVYEKPTELIEFDCDEDLYYIKNNQVDLAVTLNHRMYVGNREGKNYKIQLAKDIMNKRVKYLKNVEKFNEDKNNEYFVLDELKTNKDIFEEKKLDMNAFLPIFGIWIAEGWIDGISSVCFATHKQRVKDKLEESFKILGYNVLKQKDKKNDEIFNRWVVNDRQLFSVFKDISKGAINKYLPDWVWNLNMEQSKLLLESMVIGDEHYMKNGTMRYDTSSIKLANDFQKLALHSGYSANMYIKYKKGHESYSSTRNEIFRQSVDAYRLTIVKSQNHPLVNKNIKKDKSNAQDYLKHYEGKVYCCTVPSGIVYVRRNGIPVWTGNSSRH